jgi:hypothetical protein
MRLCKGEQPKEAVRSRLGSVSSAILSVDSQSELE